MSHKKNLNSDYRKIFVMIFFSASEEDKYKFFVTINNDKILTSDFKLSFKQLVLISTSQ